MGKLSLSWREFIVLSRQHKQGNFYFRQSINYIPVFEGAILNVGFIKTPHCMVLTVVAHTGRCGIGLRPLVTPKYVLLAIFRIGSLVLFGVSFVSCLVVLG